ncbi:sulfotransferase [Gracilimonas sp.]|uniref:sulfotransferase family protein n=1 Tax=Gracilimonas sp. TaxID=1974203 RepID=UPI0032EFE2CE
MSIQISQNDLQDTRDRIFFIVGTSRSGSTLLQSMLSSHNEIVIPPETHFFHSADYLNQKYKESDLKDSFRERLLHFWYDQKTRIRDLGLEKQDVGQLSKELNLTDPAELFTLQLTMYRTDRGKKIVGEKTPRHILSVKEIIKAYPNAKIISMFRDPRAAAWSEIKAHFGSPSVFVTTRRWREYVEAHEQCKRELSAEQYMMLRYKDLIEDTEGLLKNICAFLGVDFQPQMLEYYKRDEKGFAEGEESWKEGTLKPIQKDKNEEWKTALTRWQIALVEQTAGNKLEEMGYQKSEYSLSFSKNLFYQCLDFSRSIWATVTGARQEGYRYPDKSKFK